jgi:hypothetical protein
MASVSTGRTPGTQYLKELTVGLHYSILTPNGLYDSPVLLRDYILQSHDDLGVTGGEAAEIVNALPEAIQRAPCFRLRLTGAQCYEYALPFDLPNGQVLFGAPQVPPVKKLIAAVHALLRYTRETTRTAILRRLENRQKHDEVLAELAPLALAWNLRSADHEVPGCESHTIDWHLRWEDGTQLLLEVKSRIYDVIETLPKAHPARPTTLVPPTAPQRLFKDVERKFPSRSPSECLQGAWVEVPVKQNKRAIDEHFARMDPAKAHLGIIWSGDIADRRAYLLCHDGIDGPAVLHLFGLGHSEELVF